MNEPFDRAWSLLKDFYYGTENPLREAGEWDATKLNRNPDKWYYTGVNLNHPIHQFKDWLKGKEAAKEKMTENEMIQSILQTIMHEEGHQAVFNPLKENVDLEFGDIGYEPKYYSESTPPNRQQEYGAMLVEGKQHNDIMAELRRRNI